MDQSAIGKALLIIGLILVIAGVIFLLAGKIPFIGKLPGDFSWKGKNWSVHFPLATSILISIILSLILFIISRFK